MHTRLNVYSRILIGLFLCIPLLCAASMQSVTLDHSKVNILADKKQWGSRDSLWLMIEIEMQPKWYTYWLNPGDSGLPPKLSFEKGIQSPPILAFPPKVIQVGDYTDYGYYDQATFVVELPKTFIRSETVDFTLDWVTCFDMCVPQQAQIHLDIPSADESKTSTWSELIHEKIQLLHSYTSVPSSVTNTKDELTLVFKLADKPSRAPLVLVAQPKLVKTEAKQFWSYQDNELSIKLKKDIQQSDFVSGYLQIENKSYTFQSNIPNVSAVDGAKKSASLQLGAALALAFLGGLLLNLMPCVFPVLTLKILSLTKMKHASFFVRMKHVLVYSLGIIASFIALAGIMILMQKSGHLMGWGFQMQSLPFLIIMTYVLYLVSLNLLGWVEFILPMPLSSPTSKPESVASSFYSGLLITLIATPCTTPFMAPAIGFALTQDSFSILSIFIALGFGLAFPFILIALLPVLIKIIPKPGPWLNTFKEALAFPMLISTVWMLWLIARSGSSNSLGLVGLGLVGISFLVWFQHKPAHRNKVAKSLVYAITITLLVLPFFIQSDLISQNKTYHSVYKQGDLEKHLLLHPKTFVNVTADWCLTCKVNDSLVLSNAEIARYFKEKGIETYTLDWSQPNDGIATYLASFKRIGVPLYVYYSPNNPPVVLPQLLTKSIVYESIEGSALPRSNNESL